jgi:hypothetical protein
MEGEDKEETLEPEITETEKNMKKSKTPQKGNEEGETLEPELSETEKLMKKDKNSYQETQETPEIKVDLMNIKCTNHTNKLVNKICINKKCKDKLLCPDCMTQHQEHATVDIKEINTIYQNKVENYPRKVNQYYSSYKTLEKKDIKEACDNLKKEITNKVEEFIKNFLQSIKEYKKEEYMKKIEESFKNIDESREILGNNLLILYENREEKEMIYFQNYLAETFKYYMNLIESNIEEFKKKLEEFNNFSVSHVFEFSKYSTTKDFPYKLAENNTKVIKEKEAPLSVVKTIMPMEKGNKYELEYIPFYDGKEDFQVGICTEEAFTNKSLLSENTIGISDKGFIMGNQIVNETLLVEDQKKIIFMIDLKNGKFEFTLGDHKYITWDLNKEETYYPMVAIKNVGNSVSLKSKRLPDN